LTEASTPNAPLANAVVLLCEPHGDIGSVTRANLKRAGAADVIWRRTPEGAVAALEDGGLNLALVDTSLGDLDTATAIAPKIRFGELGPEPFLPLVMTTAAASLEIVRAALTQASTMW